MRTTNATKLIGYCAVDSGQIMLTDPCYVKDFVDELERGEGFDANLTPINGTYPYTYNGACSATCSEEMAGELGQPFRGAGVVVSSGYGDGSYPVYATFNHEGRISEARIVFISDEDEESEDEE